MIIFERRRIHKANSSSIHLINGDYFLTHIQKLLWIIANLICNVRLSYNAFNLQTFQFNSNKLDIRVLDSNNTPSRNLCNLFWSTIDLTKLIPLGYDKNGLRVLEIGCGSGRYFQLLLNYNPKISYVGIDKVASKDWNKFNNSLNAQFFEDSAENLAEYLKNVDVVITQSSLEHIEADLDVFQNLKEYAITSGRKFISINLVPSPVYIALAPFHGIRQYGRNSIDKICRTVGSEAQVDCFLLGGPHTTLLHFKSITWPSLRKKYMARDKESFLGDTLTAIETDCRNPKSIKFWNATFIAVIIRFNSNKLE